MSDYKNICITMYRADLDRIARLIARDKAAGLPGHGPKGQGVSAVIRRALEEYERKAIAIPDEKVKSRVFNFGGRPESRERKRPSHIAVRRA